MSGNFRLIHFNLIWLIAVLVVSSFRPQESLFAKNPSADPKDVYASAKDIVENPLKPADTSSPRDMLHGFFTDMDIVLNDLQQGGIISSKAGYRAFCAEITSRLNKGAQWEMYRYCRAAYVYYTDSFTSVLHNQKQLEAFLDRPGLAIVATPQKEFDKVKDKLNLVVYILAE